VNNGEGDASRTAEENRIKFHRLVKEVSDMIRSQGMKARAERTRQGGPNMRPLEKFERKVMAATLELAGKGELDEITAQANQGASIVGDFRRVLYAQPIGGRRFHLLRVHPGNRNREGQSLFQGYRRRRTRSR